MKRGIAIAENKQTVDSYMHLKPILRNVIAADTMFVFISLSYSILMPNLAKSF